MSISVSDISGNRNDKIANAAKVLGKSEHRKLVFKTIYTGKKSIKTVHDIMNSTGLNRVRVLQEAGKLASEDIVTQLESKINGETAYEKIRFYSQNKNLILSLASDSKKLSKFPTKANPMITPATIKVSFPKSMIEVEKITIDDTDSFFEVKQIDSSKNLRNIPFYEQDIKKGIKKILGETGDFTDWGGEPNDIFTKIKLNGKLLNAAICLKGKGTTGKLIPKKMGKNGDQIQRLFKSPADVFLVQYWDQIDESILDLMKSLATAKSALDGKKIYYGIIDGKDTMRLHEAYSEAFK